MKNLKDDIKIWMENKEVEKLFNELGYEFLKDNLTESAIIKQELSDKTSCTLYLELLNKIFDSSTFLIKDKQNNLYGYKNDASLTYLGEDSFFVCKNLNLIDNILFNEHSKGTKRYKNIQNQFALHGLKVVENCNEYYELKCELYKAKKVCEYGRTLKEKEWNITKKEFLEWRKPRFGENNPTKIISKVWEYGVHTRDGAYWINEKFEGASSFDEGAAWCFERFGKSVTFMPDGREIHIAGEHEDRYDPDFYIYNDVTVVYPDDSIEFYNYPKEIFPSTDFHSATLVGDIIIMIGSLGYYGERKISKTQILLLDTKSYKIEKIEPIGVQPGWIHNHKALLSEDKKRIKIVGGEIDLGGDVS